MGVKKIGYACLNLDIEGNYKTCRKKNLNEENIDDLVRNNLNILKKMAIYNEENNIEIYRISSDLIPFGSLILEEYSVIDKFKNEFNEIGEILKKSNQRFSVHPGQYTVLNSPREDVVNNSIEDLIYHYNILKALGGSSENKIVLHIGGKYQDKEKSMERFIDNLDKVPKYIKDVLIIENDHSIYDISDLLYISKKTGLPIVFDYFHHILNKPIDDKGLNYYIGEVEKTWTKKDGQMIFHYSQKGDKKIGSHSYSIAIEEFLRYKEKISYDYDLILEVKDKNRSALKVINTLENNKKNIEKEWARYKYLVLSKSQKSYKSIREYLKNEKVEGRIFYGYIEEALALDENIGEVINSYSHIWGYFKDRVDSGEKNKFEKLLLEYREEKIKKEKVLNYLIKILKKYPNNYLSKSYIFNYK